LPASSSPSSTLFSETKNRGKPLDCQHSRSPRPSPRLVAYVDPSAERGEREKGRVYRRRTYPRGLRGGVWCRCSAPQGVAFMRRHRREGGVQCRARVNADPRQRGSASPPGGNPGPRVRLKATIRPQILRGAVRCRLLELKSSRCPSPRCPLHQQSLERKSPAARAKVLSMMTEALSWPATKRPAYAPAGGRGLGSRGEIVTYQSRSKAATRLMASRMFSTELA
jgi:hypothetical protein